MKIFEVTLGDGDVITINRIHFMKFKDKLMRVTLTKEGAPIIKEGVTSEEKIHPNGRKDCIIHVPCLELSSELKDPNLN